MKCALLIGINYTGLKNELRGCVEDVKHIEKLLIKCGYDKIILLTDDGVVPSRDNIMRGFNELLGYINNGCDEAWIHYSGHGSHVPDYDGDEQDGYDEVLIPIDMMKNGYISDDLINENFISRITNNDVKLTIFMDCCHSGTVMDLQYHYVGEWKCVNNKKALGKIICISGCRDSEQSAEYYKDGRWCGAMTTTFLEFVQKNISLRELLFQFKHRLQPFGQVPQLTSNCELNLDVIRLRLD